MKRVRKKVVDHIPTLPGRYTLILECGHRSYLRAWLREIPKTATCYTCTKRASQGEIDGR